MSDITPKRLDLETWCKLNNKEYLLEEWDYSKNTLTPEHTSRGSDKKVSWICPKGHHYDASVLSRTGANSGCPYCSGVKVLKGFNDLETWCNKNNMNHIPLEWDYDKNAFLPSEISHANNKKVSWICPNGHHYDARIGNRTRLNNGCPYCSGRKTLKGFNDLETWCVENNRQDLMDEWDYDKNTIKPSEISPANNKKVWWLCPLGHSYDSTIGSRTGHKTGCPYCSSVPKRVLVGFNDLDSWCRKNDRTDLLDEWNYDRNTKTPSEYTFGSGKSVWWKCRHGHEWRSIIGNRTKKGLLYNCPICGRKQTSLPEQTVAFYVSQEYEIEQRNKIGGKEVDIYIPQYHIAIEYDGMLWHSGREQYDMEKSKKLISHDITLIRLKESTENTVTTGYDNKLYIIDFIAKKGDYTTENFTWALETLFHIINELTGKNTIPTIDISQDQPKIRAHYMYALKSNSLATVFPELANEWNYEKNEGVVPEAFSSKNGTKVWWKCKNGHEWEASIHSRSMNKLGCPFCAGQRIIKGYNDFKSWATENNPSLLSEWDYEKNSVLPEDVSKRNMDKVWWKCSEGHVWEASISNRVNGTNCPICNTGNDGNRGKKSLSEWCRENNSTLCDEWDYEKNELTPDKITYGSHKKAWWKCSNGHSWQAQVKSRTYNHGCPYCSGTRGKTLVGVNDLKTWCEQNDRLYIINEWDHEQNDGLVPEMFTYGSHKRIKWKCKEGHTWEAVIKERTKLNGNMCPVCRKK